MVQALPQALCDTAIACEWPDPTGSVGGRAGQAETICTQQLLTTVNETCFSSLVLLRKCTFYTAEAMACLTTCIPDFLQT